MDPIKPRDQTDTPSLGHKLTHILAFYTVNTRFYSYLPSRAGIFNGNLNFLCIFHNQHKKWNPKIPGTKPKHQV